MKFKLVQNGWERYVDLLTWLGNRFWPAAAAALVIWLCSWGVAIMGADKKCLSAEYAGAIVTWDYTAFCIRMVQNTTWVVPLEEI